MHTMTAIRCVQIFIQSTVTQRSSSEYRCAYRHFTLVLPAIFLHLISFATQNINRTMTTREDKENAYASGIEQAMMAHEAYGKP